MIKMTKREFWWNMAFMIKGCNTCKFRGFCEDRHMIPSCPKMLQKFYETEVLKEDIQE